VDITTTPGAGTKSLTGSKKDATNKSGFWFYEIFVGHNFLAFLTVATSIGFASMVDNQLSLSPLLITTLFLPNFVL
jgi:hypothetical protein